MSIDVPCDSKIVRDDNDADDDDEIGGAPLALARYCMAPLDPSFRIDL